MTVDEDFLSVNHWAHVLLLAGPLGLTDNLSTSTFLNCLRLLGAIQCQIGYSGMLAGRLSYFHAV